ncbi:MAG: permease, partial [Kiritimatiellae bacterium]|nr:permease [Kiritimatiellia bacterium]
MNHILQIGLEILQAFWAMTGVMAPYLLFGFFTAGVLRVLVKQEFVERHLGRRGLMQTLKATLIGVPMPLCSCGVIPVAAALRRDGAGKGATAAFLASTPQTGVDSIFATWGMLGGVFAVIRVLAAFFSGLISGVAVDLFDRTPDAPPTEPLPSEIRKATGPADGIRLLFRYGFITLPADIGKSLVVGLVIA